MGHYSPAKYHPGRSCIIHWSKNCQKTGIKIIELHRYTLPIHVLFAIRWLSASFRWSLRAWLVVWVRVLILLVSFPWCLICNWTDGDGGDDFVPIGAWCYQCYQPDNCREPLTRCCSSVPMPMLSLFCPIGSPSSQFYASLLSTPIRYVVCCYDEGYRRCICLCLAMLRLRWASYDLTWFN